MSDLYARTFPDEPAAEQPVRELETRVRETRELADHLGVTGSSVGVLEVLREISARIPEGLEMSLRELRIERRSVQARGYAKDFESVGRIRELLAESSRFSEVRVSDVVTDVRAGGKSFSLTLQLGTDP